MVKSSCPFLKSLQPGVVRPEQAAYRPMLLMSVMAGPSGPLIHSSAHSRRAVFDHEAFVSFAVYVFAQVLFLYYGGIGKPMPEASRQRLLAVMENAGMLESGAPCL